ncbi:MAG: MFS transporter [Bryobacteraceae bacterium]|nr:MFS transporter [Bryobacteraceae bacterium]
MTGFAGLLTRNRNYRYTWCGQVVSEIGDHFNNLAVFSLALHYGDAGLVLATALIARGLPMLIAGPLSGVLLDRWDRKRVMIVSDLCRALVALLFIFCEGQTSPLLLYVLSACLMFASPFFTSGRAAILPTIASAEELHTANSVTLTTQWLNTAIGAFLGGLSVDGLGYTIAFFLNAVSFLFSAWCISHLRSPLGHFRALRPATEEQKPHPWSDYKDGLRYIRSQPLILAILLSGVGWAIGGGAAQILFSLFGERVFHRGATGIGTLWGAAALGLVAGGVFAHWLGKRLDFATYKKTVALCFVLHGLFYVAFSQMTSFWLAMLFIALSRAGSAISSILNNAQVLRHVRDEYRGRVFSAIETVVWSMMMISMMVAGLASLRMSPRTIGAWAGSMALLTAVTWLWADWRGWLPEPDHARRTDTLKSLHVA